MNPRLRFLGLSSVIALASSASFVSACSSFTSVASDDAGMPTEAGADDSATADAETGTDAAPMGDLACAAEATRSACNTCCVKNHPVGSMAFQDSLLSCACMGIGVPDGGPPVCATQCAATTCSATPTLPDSACNTCLQGALAGTCKGPVTASCNANADCVAEEACLMPCATKN